MLEYFRFLGIRIEQAWIARGYDEEVFPQIVLDKLSETSPHQHVKYQDIVDWCFEAHRPFRQSASAELFGEPPITLFQAPRFYIEALFWFSATTAIHEHSFSGAFAVLAGSSVHSHWRFTPERSVNSRMLQGRLERESTEILRPGGVRPIRSGDRLIHQLFHLEVPSVTIVVRTYVDRNQLPQYKYLLPGLAVDEESRDPDRLRRLLFIQAMVRNQLDGLEHYCRKLIEESDVESIYYLFATLAARKASPELLASLYDAARERHGSIVDTFKSVCEWQKRERIITGLRSKVTASEPRFLLALLMLMPNRDAIFDAVRLQYPQADPMSTIETWLQDMSKETIGFSFDNTNRILFRALVDGCDLEGCLTRLNEQVQSSSIEEHRSRLTEHVHKLASSDLFYALLSESPLRP